MHKQKYKHHKVATVIEHRAIVRTFMPKYCMVYNKLL